MKAHYVLKAGVCVAATLQLTACSMNPTYLRPPAPVANGYPVERSNAVPGGAAGSTAAYTRGDTQRDVRRTSQDAPAAHRPSAASLGWHTVFADTELQGLIQTALNNNRNLRVTALNVEAVAAQFRIVQSDRLPKVSGSAGFNRQRYPANGPQSFSLTQSGASSPAFIQNAYSVSLGISAFELDLFGRVKSLSEAAKARYFASVEGARTVQIALVGAVADAYFALQLAREQRTLTEQTLTDWRRSLAIAFALNAAGQSSGLDVAEVESQVESAHVDLAERARATLLAENALRLLLGTGLPDAMDAAGAIDAVAVTTTLERSGVMVDLPVGLPSDLLLQRPDIRQAEQRLIAANADIGAARAAFFPRLSLTSTLGFSSLAVRGLFSQAQSAWLFGPQITVPIFQAGSLRAELRLAEVRKSVAVAQYEQIIQAAFREVADGLAGQETYGNQLAAQTRLVSKAQQQVAIAAARYRAGFDTRLALLVSQRQLYAAQNRLLTLRGAQLSNVVALYKALGGGIAAEDVAPVPAACAA